ncbi:MAG: ATP-dependent DNA helicase RecG [Clostridia bacterium]|nr:ATP-dependent DNA helicase RecG [Clostridia bacterium]
MRPTDPITALRGVGAQRAKWFAQLDIRTVWDLLRHYPRQYADWSQTVPIMQAPLDTPCCVRGTVLSDPAERRIRAGMVLYTFPVSDGESCMQVTLFNNRFLAARIRAGREYLFYGPVKRDFFRAEMSSPQIAEVGRAHIRPVYRQTQGLTSVMIESAVETALRETAGQLTDPLPPGIRQQYKLCGREYALHHIHFPADPAALQIARRRLVFEELFFLQLGMLYMRRRSRDTAGAVITQDRSEEFFARLPFTPTGAQRRAVADCMADLAGGIAMNRLIQGDVGSGKTAVAAAVADSVCRAGYQAALMVPTEILARQHYTDLSALLAGSGVTVELLVSSMKAADKRRVREQTADGTVQLLIGTQALLSEQLQFNRLALVITDEQHRFGVGQRAGLSGKGNCPHVMVMSATPIPRTLALMIYGDLDLSVLDELPPGRRKVATYAVGSDKRMRAWKYIRKHVDAGLQAYVVCPLVEDEEGESSLSSATAYVKELTDALPGVPVGLLHGRMKAAEKERVMADFVAGRLAVLVSTVVIEVGVNVPNAALMLIENAERFGLAQLHQLRGRVGRGRAASTCILISDAQGEEAKRRLQVMCQTNDGFRIADEDLKLRGPGDFFGNRQHGLPALRIADLAADMPMLQQARQAAEDLFRAGAQDDGQKEALLREVRLLFADTPMN